MTHNLGHHDAGHPRSKGLWRTPEPALINVYARAERRLGALGRWVLHRERAQIISFCLGALSDQERSPQRWAAWAAQVADGCRCADPVLRPVATPCGSR